ncbi:IS701 family transposase [Streptomyces rubradiris]|uniref:IS701 family transposase n=1 Tax=Streptomyces rubradiris TaxID=285531 RepID=UPI0036E25145
MLWVAVIESTRFRGTTVKDSADIHCYGRIPGGGDELLSEFVDRLFGGLPRVDQRNRSREYVTGLLVTPGKKTLRRMAAVVSDSPHASQALQQFLNVSPWDWRPVRRALVEWAAERRPTLTWTLGLAVFPKRGDRSAGVHRRFVPGADRTLNCQLGIGLFLGSGDAFVPVDWRLVLPGRWQCDEALRASVRIPSDEHTPSEGACALDLVRVQRAVTGRADIPLVVDLTQVPHDASFLAGLAGLGTGFVAQIPGSTLLHLPTGQGRSYTASQLMSRAVDPAGSSVVPATGRRGHSRVCVRAVRLDLGDRPVPQRTYGLLVEHPTGENGGARYYVTDLTQYWPTDLLRLADNTRRAEEAVRDMRDHYGLLDFEGRSYPGWHHHMTLVSAAYAFRRLAGGRPQAGTPSVAAMARAA